MPENKISILATRQVDESLVALAGSKGIQLDALSFIETEKVQDIATQQEIEAAGLQFATVVFTSSNAVDAVTDALDGHIPEWDIYCIGHKTRETVEAYFGENSIAVSADDATQLAAAIIDNTDTEEVIFFCGNRRRKELPDKLEQNNITVQEIIVYNTNLVKHQVSKSYHGILFFSPSAVQSFFSHNTSTADTVLFVIGGTTKEAVLKYSRNKTVVAILPDKNQLVEDAIHYFS